MKLSVLRNPIQSRQGELWTETISSHVSEDEREILVRYARVQEEIHRPTVDASVIMWLSFTRGSPRYRTELCLTLVAQC